MKNRIYILTLVLLLAPGLSPAVNLDSLWGVWNDKTQADTNRLKAMNKIAWDGYLFSQPDSAFYFAELQYKFARIVGNKKWMANAYNLQGVSFAIRGNYGQALLYYNQSLNIREEIGDNFEIAKSYGNIGSAYRDQGNYGQALSYYSKSLKIFEELDDKRGLAGYYIKIGSIYQNQGNHEQALAYYGKCLKIFEELDNKRGMASAYLNIGVIYQNQGNHEQALAYYGKCLKIQEEIGDKNGMAGSYNNIGTLYKHQGNYKQALEDHSKSLKLKEEIGDVNGMADSYNNIGIIYQEQGNYKEALQYYQKSLEITEEIGDKRGMAISLGNTGSIYTTQGNYEQALLYYQKGLTIQKEIGDKKNIARLYVNIGSNYSEQGNYEQSLSYYEKSLQIQVEIDDKEGMSISYINMGILDFEQENYLEALDLGKKALSLAQEVGAVLITRNASKLLYDVYKKTGQPAKSLEMHELYTEMHDSLNSMDNKEAVIKLEYQHKYDKEQVIAEAKHQEQMALSAEREKRQELIAYGAGGGLVMVLLFAFFILNRLQVTRRQKDTIEGQKQIVEEQKELVEEQKKDLTDSIHYAENIQQSLLPTIDDLKEVLPDGFVLFQPKDIVSGDFYWLQHHKDKVYFAVCDCTGHGVPGAFMSMIGSSLLDEAVVEKGVTKPNEIFFEVRKGFIDALKQTGGLASQKDGMDAVLCSWNKNGNLEYALAYNPLLLIRKGELIETKADKQPVGFHTLEQKPFTHHELKLEKGDTVYIFSDGYSDQFGGPKNKKFMLKNFKKLLLSIQDKTMNEQKTILETTMAEWKGATEQIDDILVMGVRF